MTLDHDDIELIAVRVAELLRGEMPEPTMRLADAATVASELGVDRDWVYAHARELGAARLGGEHGRLRFDLAKIRRDIACPSQPGQTAAPRRTRRRRPQRHRCDVDLLPYTEVQSTGQIGGRAAHERPRPDTGR